MAVAYLDRQVVSRGKGQSIIAKAAYNSCSSLEDIDGLKDFSKKGGLAYAKILTADSSPAPARGEFWKNVEAHEKRKDAQLGYTYEVALPIELSKSENIELAEEFAKKIMARYDFGVIDLCIHYPTKRKPHADKNKENPHFHLLTPTRTKEGNKIRNFGNKEEDIREIRRIWEETANRHLQRAGQAIRISLESVETQLQGLNDEITELEAQKAAITQELLKIEDRIHAESNRATEQGKPRENAVKTDDRARGKDEPAGKGLQRSHESHKSGTGPAGSTPGERRGTNNQTPPAGNRGFGRTNEFPRKQPARHLQTDLPLTSLAKRIASRLDAMRYQRQGYCLKNPLSTIARQLASRLDGARYVRSYSYYQQRQEIENPIHCQTY